MTQVPKHVVDIATAYPKAAKKFVKYMKDAEKKIFVAQKKFAKEMDKYVQAAIKQFYKAEKIDLPEATIKEMEKEAAKACAIMYKAGDKNVKDSFKKMSAGLNAKIKAAPKAKAAPKTACKKAACKKAAVKKAAVKKAAVKKAVAK